MPRHENTEAKKIVYLWGAGATQGELMYSGSAVSLLMRDVEETGVTGVATRILARLGRKKSENYRAEHGITVDIEKLISLLASTGVAEQQALAELIREYYFFEIRNRLADAALLRFPRLASALMELHRVPSFLAEIEDLRGMITTNHDGLLQVASQKVYGGINVCFPFESSDFRLALGAPPILQVHGSFTWSFGVPTHIHRLRRETTYSSDLVWIPPTTAKESKLYPFNKLSGVAYELLSNQCDVLRVVGCSLTQNDWNVLTLIFAAQRHLIHTGGSSFRIELINSQKTGVWIQKECSFLRNLTPIGYLSEGQFEDYKDDALLTDEMKNPFGYWLKEKVMYHLRRGHLSREDMTTTILEVAGEQSAEVG